MTDGQNANGQAPSQGQSGQASQAQGQSPSMSQELFGKSQSSEQASSQAGTGQGARLEGQREGETLEAYATRLAKEVSDARKDAGKYRTQLRQFQGDDSKDENGLTEFQRLAQQVETLNRDLEGERNARKAEKVSTALITAFAEAGALSPARLVRMVDVNTELELSSDGSPTLESVQALASKLKAEMPAMFTDVRGNGDGHAGNGGLNGESHDMNYLIRQRAAR